MNLDPRPTPQASSAPDRDPEPRLPPVARFVRHGQGVRAKVNPERLAEIEAAISEGRFGPAQCGQIFADGCAAAEEFFDRLTRAGRREYWQKDHGCHDVFYQATPLRQMEPVIRAGLIRSEDCFADIGCGPGARMPLYVHLRTGARALGVEKAEQHYHRAAARIAELNLTDKIRIAHGDALKFDYSGANVFLLAQPFDRQATRKFMRRLRPRFEFNDPTFLACCGSEQMLARVRWLARTGRIGEISIFKPRWAL